MGQVEVRSGEDDGVAEYRLPAHPVQLARPCRMCPVLQASVKEHNVVSLFLAAPAAQRLCPTRIRILTRPKSFVKN